MTDHHQTSDEVAANLLDQVQLDDALFIKDEPVENVEVAIASETKTQTVDNEQVAPAPLPMPKRLSVPQSPAAEKTTPSIRVGGFSALLDHLKAEALRHDQRSKIRQEALRSAA
ncbi:MAG: hypothetical protein CMJ19_09650 [Phycisphaeraceae bacterium]|nr:hypothetical protein [Phycisphaeraceae bacterium]